MRLRSKKFEKEGRDGKLTTEKVPFTSFASYAIERGEEVSCWSLGHGFLCFRDFGIQYCIVFVVIISNLPVY